MEEIKDIQYKAGILIETDYDPIHNRAYTKTGFWGKAGAGAIFMAKDTGRILIQHRSPYVLQPDTWGVFGGAIDPNESPQQAATRESEEEAGITPHKNNVIPLYVYHDSKSGFQYHNFLILTDHEFTPQSGQQHAWESQGYTWTNYGNWPSPLHFGLKSLLSDPKSDKILKELSVKFSS